MRTLAVLWQLRKAAAAGLLPGEYCMHRCVLRAIYWFATEWCWTCVLGRFVVIAALYHSESNLLMPAVCILYPQVV
jgi:hypothetical protein